ncbi:galactokinase [Massilia arenosa]|uniref:Galactokinase n=1 Tax=Zemynaea arenosa TaxID=2561931 RepID=A0A4Y9SBG7_9BURK|nr:galactokinase [Massilia arenosa]TFW16969.1 galactokinase [Massilia arenosa]
MISLEQFFDGAPAVHASAPGRVNLLGEHTDYNDGFMLPVATPQRTTVAIAPSGDDHFHFYADVLDETVTFQRQHHAPQGFGSYIEGCIRLMEEHKVEVPPLRVYTHTTLPVGSGLSSSAALEVAMLRALRELTGAQVDDVLLAQMAQQAEIRYAKVQCGIMDQMASSLADEEHMLFIDARSLEHRVLPLPPGAEIIVMDTGVPRKLAGSKYNERRSECNEAARLLGVQALRDVTDPDAVEKLPSPLRERARHVVRENLRVLEATRGVSAQRFGELMNESHFSLRDDYQVSIEELDVITARLREQDGVYGARLTGAGFGGACVALCEKGRAQAAAQAALERYNAGHRKGRVLIPELSHK